MKGVLRMEFGRFASCVGCGRLLYDETNMRIDAKEGPFGIPLATELYGLLPLR